MNLQLDPMLILFFVLGLVILYIAGWLLLVPFKLLLKFLANSILGALVLIGLNLIGGIFSVTIALTPLNAVIVGVFGIPGILLLLILKLIFL
jgi:inhibitor of the pro-sigma K processing machinery